MSKYRDHLGNEYTSIEAMCNHWGISVSLFEKRLRDGWTLEKALSISVKPRAGKECIDHKGNRFRSLKEMCDYWGVCYETYFVKLKEGKSLEEIFSSCSSKKCGKVCRDHLGNKFNSIQDMCDYWGVSTRHYRTKIKEGVPLKDILTRNCGTKVKDHLGNEFSSVHEMCDYWGVKTDLYYHRLRRGKSLEEALSTPVGQKSDDSTKNKSECKSVSNRSKLCKDHLGNSFSSIQAMCNYWGISYKIYRQRVYNLGWSLEKTLSTPVREKKSMCQDHLGNVFDSEKAMCKYWNIDTSVFRSRINGNWSLDKALSVPVPEYTAKSVVDKSNSGYVDHLGNSFSNMKEMCKYWGISYGLLSKRLKNGWSLKDALTIKNSSGIKCKDHLGNEFSSIKEMSTYWGISDDTYARRKSRGWSLEKILTTPISSVSKSCKDHLGNEFNSIKEMLDYWKIPRNVYNSRIIKGWSLKDTLSTPIVTHMCKDHKGNTFDSLFAMCDYWKIPYATYLYRVKNGWSLEKALTIPIENKGKKVECKDHLGNSFCSLTNMCKHWGITLKTLINRLNSGWSLEKALTTVNEGKYKKCKDHLGNEFNSITDMCEYWNIPKYIYYNRLDEGWSLEKILTTPVNNKT